VEAQREIEREFAIGDEDEARCASSLDRHRPDGGVHADSFHSDILRIPQAVDLFRHLGYPSYLLPFLGIAKMLAVAAILAPGLRWLKEWAYAGLIFDLIGAVYSHLAVGDPPNAWIFPVIGLLLVIGSYLVYRRELIGEV
jgi:DoxX-like family